MSTYREIPCKYYIAFGECQKGRGSHQAGYCQHCRKYEPRAKVRLTNKKKAYFDKLRKKYGKVCI